MSNNKLVILDKLCVEECWTRRKVDLATTMRMITAIGTKNLVRIKMIDYIINVMVVREQNRHLIRSMVERALKKRAEEVN